MLKDSIWTYLEQYDLPVVVGLDIPNSPQSMGTQVGISFHHLRNYFLQVGISYHHLRLVKNQLF